MVASTTVIVLSIFLAVFAVATFVLIGVYANVQKHYNDLSDDNTTLQNSYDTLSDDYQNLQDQVQIDTEAFTATTSPPSGYQAMNFGYIFATEGAGGATDSTVADCATMCDNDGTCLGFSFNETTNQCTLMQDTTISDDTSGVFDTANFFKSK